MDYTEKVYEENKHLKETLKQLVQRYQALQRQKDLLQKQQHQLQLERTIAQGLHCQRFPPRLKSITSAAPNTKKPPTAATNN